MTTITIQKCTEGLFKMRYFWEYKGVPPLDSPHLYCSTCKKSTDYCNIYDTSEMYVVIVIYWPSVRLNPLFFFIMKDS